MAGVAVVYCLLAVLSDFLRAPPIYASSLWLPAGAALLAWLWFGRAIAIGLWLGAFAFNGGKLLWMTPGSSASDWLAAVCISTGSTLAAALGAWLARRLTLWPVAATGWRLIVAAVATAVISSTCSALVGASSLWLTNKIPSLQWADTALTWALGDAAGILLLLPFAYWPREGDRAERRRYVGSLVLPLMAALALGLFTFLQLARIDRERQLSHLRREAGHLQTELEEGGERAVALMHALGASLDGDADRVERSEFQRFANGLRQLGTSVQALQWAPRIETKEELAAYQALLQSEGMTDLQLHPVPGITGWRAKPILVPITFMVPMEGNRPAYGLDLWSEPQRRQTLEAAWASGEVVASPPVQLVQRPGGPRAYLFDYAVRRGRSEQAGYVQGVFTIEQLTASARRQTEKVGLHWELRDLAQPEQPLTVIGPPPNEGLTSLPPQVLRFPVAGRDWELRVSGTPLFLAGAQSLNLWAAQLGSVLVASAWGLFLFAQWAQKQRLAQLHDTVQQRNRELAETQQRFERMAEAAPTAIFQTDRQGRLSYANPAHRQLVGEQAPAAQVHADDRVSIEQMEHAARQQGVAYRTLCRLQGQAAGDRWVLLQANPLRDGAGHFDGHIGSMIDITPLKRSEQALERLHRAPSHDRQAFLDFVTATLAELFDCEVAFVSTFSGAQKTHCQTRAYWVNGTFCAPRHYALEGTPCAEIDQRDVLFMADSVRSRYPRDARLSDHAAEAFAAAALRDGAGEITGYVGLMRSRPIQSSNVNTILHLFRLRISAEMARWTYEDQQQQLLASLEERVTERTAALREAAERAEQANRAKSDFLATMSHEIRTPMNSAQGLLELVLRQPMPDDQRAMLETVQDASRSLLRLIDDLLDLSQIEAGAVRLDPEPVRLAPLLHRLEGLYRQTALNKQLEFSLSIDPTLAAAYRVDRLRLRQILANLIANAIKFTDRGRVAVRVERLSSDPSGDTLEFRVQDTGIGVDAVQLAQLFQPFSRAKGDSARTRGGTGLGLSISRRLAECMGGSLTMQSTPGQGSTLRLTLVLPSCEPAVEDSAPPTLSQAGQLPTPVARPLVLVAEDHVPSRQLFARQLQELGYPSVLVEDGEQAWEYWLQSRPSIVLTDCNMPRLDGYGLAQRIREAERRLGGSRTTILACTADLVSSRALQTAQQTQGLDALLTKPLPLSQLAKALAEASAQVLAPAVGMPSTGAVADSPRRRAALQHLTALSGSQDSAASLLSDFVGAFVPDSQAVQSGLRDGDALLCQQALHRLKGAVAALGDPELHERISAAHELSRRGALEELAACWPVIEQGLQDYTQGAA